MVKTEFHEVCQSVINTEDRALVSMVEREIYEVLISWSGLLFDIFGISKGVAGGIDGIYLFSITTK